MERKEEQFFAEKKKEGNMRRKDQEEGEEMGKNTWLARRSIGTQTVEWNVLNIPGKLRNCRDYFLRNEK